MTRSTTNTVERAFELARSGRYATIGEIVRALKGEGFANVDAHTAGASIRADLRRECAASRTAAAPAG